MRSCSRTEVFRIVSSPSETVPFCLSPVLKYNLLKTSSFSVGNLARIVFFQTISQSGLYTVSVSSYYKAVCGAQSSVTVPECVRACVSLTVFVVRARALHLSDPPPCVLHQRRSERRKLGSLPDIWLWRAHVLASDVCTLCSWTMRKDVKRWMKSCFVHIRVSQEAVVGFF